MKHSALAAVVIAAAVVAVDGDTVDVDGKRWRLQGFDTPETFYAQCTSERLLGQKAKQRLQQLIDTAHEVETMTDGKRERWKRILGRLFVDGRDVGEVLISEGLAVRYNGKGRRRDWCQFSS